MTMRSMPICFMGPSISADSWADLTWVMSISVRILPSSMAKPMTILMLRAGFWASIFSRPW